MIGAFLLALFAAALDPGPHVRTFADVRSAWRASDVALLDRHGVVLHEVRVDATRRRLAWTPLAATSPALSAAVLAAEDRRFREHGGVDVRAVAAAAASRLTGGPRRGASTITMQVASMLDPALRRRRGPRTLAQKWRQMTAAWAIESRWTKDEILEAYLNLVTYRGELQGTGAAAAALFGKAPHGLTVAEAAVMAVLLRAPAASVETVVRRATTLSVNGGHVVAEAATRALTNANTPASRVQEAPHVAHRLLPMPTAKRARPSGDARTTLDARTQRIAFEALRRQLLDVRNEHVGDGAVLVVDNRTGEVLAYVGSAGDVATAAWVDGVQARRQPGSALKPFVYAFALDRRLLTPASRLDDSPLDVPVFGGLYRPRNYDDVFRGPVTVRTALASSLNVPAVRALGVVGENAFVEHLRELGFTGVDEAGDFYGPALALGSADVRLWDLVNAYRTLANGGVTGSLRLSPDAPAPAGPVRVYSAAAAFAVTDVLADREARSATFGLENALATPFWTAVKTGTSKDMRDNWCVGFSRRYTVGVWVGNASGDPMRNVSGVTGAAPVWLDVMRWLHRDGAAPAPPPPAGVVAALVDGRREWFLAGTEPVATTVAAAPRLAGQIVAPASGTIIAVDPDIPATRQRVLFEARDAGHARWQLDGVDLGPARATVLWPPRAGRHTLTLVDSDGVRDVVRFDVRH